MKKLFLILIILTVGINEGQAVLKERDLEKTLEILRQELTEYHRDLTDMTSERKQQNEQIFGQLMETMKQSGQNALMLYSQKQNYVFDLTYACHQATEQYNAFRRSQLPFLDFLATTDADIAKYDSLVNSLTSMHENMLSDRGRLNRNVCLTLATNIRNTLTENREQITDYIHYYEATESRLKYLNDYAGQRYNDIQTGIFRNGGNNYFAILKSLQHSFRKTRQTVADKYKSTSTGSQWDSSVIFGLFFIIVIYVLIATGLNLLVFRFLLPKKFHTPEFLKKRTCVILATTIITFALIMGILRATLDQNFFIMASDLLIEYAWLLGVILISLLLRVGGDQIRSAFYIYAPLVFIGFIVISFRIILIPNELVSLVFPPVLLACSIWQWFVIARAEVRYVLHLHLAVGVRNLCCTLMDGLHAAQRPGAHLVDYAAHVYTHHHLRQPVRQPLRPPSRTRRGSRHAQLALPPALRRAAACHGRALRHAQHLVGCRCLQPERPLHGALQAQVCRHQEPQH